MFIDQFRIWIVHIRSKFLCFYILMDNTYQVNLSTSGYRRLKCEHILEWYLYYWKKKGRRRSKCQSYSPVCSSRYHVTQIHMLQWTNMDTNIFATYKYLDKSMYVCMAALAAASVGPSRWPARPVPHIRPVVVGIWMANVGNGWFSSSCPRKIKSFHLLVQK